MPAATLYDLADRRHQPAPCSMLEIAAAERNTPMRRGDRLPGIDRLMREMPF